MKVASWNVNSLKVRLPQVLTWIADAQPDVLALQETKIRDEDFPLEAFTALGYSVTFTGQPAYNGVATLSRAPPRDVTTRLDTVDDGQRRLVGVTIDAGRQALRVLNVYVPNGQSVGSEKYAYKLSWMAALKVQLERELARSERCIVLGDFNVAPEDRDVHDPLAWAGKILCSEPERAALDNIQRVGFSDTFRLFDQPERTFSWWDYRAGRFRRNLGLRIDLVLASKALTALCQRASIDITPRGWERPSDHAPVYSIFSLE